MRRKYKREREIYIYTEYLYTLERERHKRLTYTHKYANTQIRREYKRDLLLLKERLRLYALGGMSCT